MKVYVLSVFDRSDHDCSYDYEIVSVFTDIGKALGEFKRLCKTRIDEDDEVEVWKNVDNNNKCCAYGCELKNGECEDFAQSIIFLEEKEVNEDECDLDFDVDEFEIELNKLAGNDE